MTYSREQVAAFIAEILGQDTALLSKLTNFLIGSCNGAASGQKIDMGFDNLQAIALNDLPPGQCFFFQDDVTKTWYAVPSQSASVQNETIIRHYRHRDLEPNPTITLNVQILYFVWDAGYFNWYVGGDRKVPLLIKREPDELTFPPTAPNSDRGVDYSEYELSDHSNLDKGNFRAIINTNYGNTFGANPIIRLGVFRLIDGEWIADDLESPTAGARSDQKTLYRKLTHVTKKLESSTEHDLVHAKGYDTIKGFRHLGNGYSFGSINLLRRYYARNFSAQEFYFDKYVEIPSEYLCYLSYLEPTENGGSQEVIVDVDFSKDQYSYSLPISAEDGAMPTITPLTEYSGGLDTYTYIGEHYLMVGKNSYITEYIKKTTPTNVEREIRFYQNKKFVSNLNTNTAFTVSHDVQGNGGFTLDYINAIQLQRYSKGDNLTFATESNFLYFEFCQTLVSKTLTIGSTHYETNEFWMSECTVNSVTTNQSGTVIFSLTLTKTPFVVGYSSLLCGIGNFAPGAYQNGKNGVLYLESGSYFDLTICSLDIAPISSGRIFDNSYLGAFNNTSGFHPFDPNDLGYLHNAILENSINYDIYYQENLYGNNLFGGQYPTIRKIQRHLSYLTYLSNSFTKLRGNKIYRFQIIYKYPEGKVYGGLPEAISESIQHPSAEAGYIRNVAGKDKRATCYVEVWEIIGGNIKRRKRPLKVPVYGLYTEDLDWIFSDILDIDLGFNDS